MKMMMVIIFFEINLMMTYQKTKEWNMQLFQMMNKSTMR